MPDDEDYEEKDLLHLNGFSKKFVRDFYRLMGKFNTHVEIAKLKDKELETAKEEIVDVKSGFTELKENVAVIKSRLEGLASTDRLILGLLVSLLLAFVGAVLYFVFAPAP